MDVPKGLIELGSWMSTTPDGTPLLFCDLRAAEIYAANGLCRRPLPEACHAS